MALSPGQVVDHYQLEHAIHRGARTTVFAAVDLHGRQRVALTVLNDAYADDALARRQLVQRAQAAGRLAAHPNIVRIHSWGQVGAAPYLVADLVEGVSLRQLLDRQPGGTPLPLPLVVTILTDVADAIDHAAAHGVAHGAVEPANVLVRDRGATSAAFLTNFGGSPADRTTTGRDHAGLRATAFELLAGRRPPDRDRASTSPRRIRPELPPAVDIVFGDGAAAGTYPTCRAFVDALTAVLPVTRTAPRRPSTAAAGADAAQLGPAIGTGAARHVSSAAVGRHRRRWAPLLVGVVLALVGGAAFSMIDGADHPSAVATTTTSTLPATTTTTSTTTSTTSTSTSTSTSTTSTSTSTSTTTSTTSTSTTTSTTVAPTSTRVTTTVAPTVAPTTTVLGPNGRVVGTTLRDPQDAAESLVVALAARQPADHLVAPGSPADIYQRWVHATAPAGDATITADGYAVTIDQPVEIGDVVIDGDGRITDLSECVDGSCRPVSQLIIWPTMCGSYTCGTVFSSAARFPVVLVATLYTRPETPIQLFELRADEPVTAVDDAGGVVWVAPDPQRLVITLPRHPGQGTQTVIAMTMSSGAFDYTAVVYGD